MRPHVPPPVLSPLVRPDHRFGMAQRQWLIGRPGTGERKVGRRASPADDIRRAQAQPAKHTLVGNCSGGCMSSGVAAPAASLSTKAVSTSSRGSSRTTCQSPSRVGHPKAVAHHGGDPQVALGVEREPVHNPPRPSPSGAEHLPLAQRPIGPDREAQNACLHRLGDVQIPLVGVQPGLVGGVDAVGHDPGRRGRPPAR